MYQWGIESKLVYSIEHIVYSEDSISAEHIVYRTFCEKLKAKSAKP